MGFAIMDLTTKPLIPHLSSDFFDFSKTGHLQTIRHTDAIAKSIRWPRLNNRRNSILLTQLILGRYQEK